MFKLTLKVTLTLLAFILLSGYVQSQALKHIGTATAPEEFENISVTPLFIDSLSSSFLIWIKKEVKPHKHLHHAEHVYILNGTGNMRMGDSLFAIASGDILLIPKNTVHSVEVTSEEPMKVISIQAPKFEGRDRIFVDDY